MFTYTNVDAESKDVFYSELLEQARHLMLGETNELANLSNLSALLNLQLQDVNWVGFYLWYPQEDQLILGPFQGKPACIRIGFGKGVCGSAVQERKTKVVSDVHAFAGHIACDADSRSELVIPMFKDGSILGVLDIDSPIPNRFSDEDASGLEGIVEVLVNSTEFMSR